MSSRCMKEKDKQKVTLYVSQDLHRQLKIRAALDGEPMSAIAERAIDFYLRHSDVVDSVETSHGHSHQVYSCPECETSLVMRDGDIRSLGAQPELIPDVAPDRSLDVIASASGNGSGAEQLGRGDLVPC